MIRPLCHTLTYTLLLGSLSGTALAINQSLPNSVSKLLQRNKIEQSALSVAILPLTSRGTATLINADKPINPASTMKLVTTYTALEMLGPIQKWKTELYRDGPIKNGVLQGNLYVKGGGDPKLNLEKLWLLLRDLRAAGVRTITGDLVLDRSYLRLPPEGSFKDSGNNDNKPYLVGPDSLLVNLKALRFIVRNEGGNIQVEAEPPIPGLRINNKIRSIRTSRCPSWPAVHYTPVTQQDGSTTVTVSGKLGSGCSGQTYLAMLNHPAYASGAIRGIWHELGGTIRGHNRQGRIPSTAKMVARGQSPDLAEIIRDINKFSNNTMARQLFLNIGAHFRQPSDSNDAQSAQRAIRQWLNQKGVGAHHLVMENGSGLSRIERVSAREMARMLEAAWRSPYAAEFISSLPLVGLDGTMRKRLRNTPLKGNAHIKTGTLKNVRAIAGFARDKNGDSWAIVAILNHSRPWGASSILDQLLLELYRNPLTLGQR